ncbi:DUF1566 domain-containing protein [Legionella resiliens]|uniref:DUF1566 domain-containing protein n=1 Tax=Legionella resiliens TaxID=2905958 RepID=A0ABS8X1T8_9GAMM|nr:MULTISPECIES: DUF1566 domain-containing protein [unclassified Legionella]MCE0722091.1 DUF1566 domain-containing protein [Legionella sp. 9fVS26]MCE3531245.1 DUF1566 domain-containing protein [Legionella sp. 8cVS16]
MRRLQQLPLYFFLFFIVPIQSLWALESSKTAEKAHLTISTGKNGVICSKSLQNCVIQVSQNLPQCLSTPGAVTITNNSRVPANNIQASSTNGFFSLYVLQNNGCPASLLPGRSCTISFFTNTSIAFFIPNVMVKGSNTNATFFDMQAVACPTQPQAILSVSSNIVNLIAGGSPQSIAVTNIGTLPASNVQASIASSPPLGVGVVSFCPALLMPNNSCQITYQPGVTPGNTTSTVFGTNAVNSIPIAVNVSMSPTTMLSVPTNAIIPAGDPGGVNIFVANLTSTPAFNVRVLLPASWIAAGVTSTTCAVIPANGSCMINIVSPGFFTVFVAQGGIVVTGDNVVLPPSIALAFSMDGYLVYSVVFPSPDIPLVFVVKDSDESSSFVWSGFPLAISGITETSTSPPDNCNGATDGACNSARIFETYEGMIPNAATLCHQIGMDNSGEIPFGTWYLPAICELGIFNSGAGGTSANCPANTPNIVTNLYSLGFLPELSLNGRYWSSTESSVDSLNNAWFQEFFANGVSTQGTINKINTYGVRCVRVFATS